MIHPDAHIRRAQSAAREEAIRALLIAFIGQSARKRRYASLEQCPFDVLLHSRLISRGATVIDAEMSADAYFALLVDLVAAHQLAHTGKEPRS